MINTLKIVEEEADETIYWLELLIDAQRMPQPKLQPLITEVNEIVAMTVASIKTIRSQRGS
jgi:four helix bundle protein